MPLTLFAAGLLVVGCAFVVLFWFLGPRHVRVTGDWQSTTGLVRRSRMVSTIEEATSHDDEGGSGTRTTLMYRPDVEYDYEVDGATFTSERIRTGGAWSSSNERAAQAVLERYPVDAQVEVYYDPDQPGRCCLDRTMNGSTYVFLAVGLVLFAFAIVMLTVAEPD